MRSPFSVYQLAHAVWNAIAVGSRIVTVSAGSYSIIRSIQNGSTTIPDSQASATTTITSVTTGKSFIIPRIFQLQTNDDGRVALTNSTTVTATRNGTAGAVTFHWTVVEYF